MIVTELHLVIFVFIIFLLTISTIIVDAAAGRCYLCSENTLAACAGSTQLNSPLYTTILQFYTEPCNGQCVLFRNENQLTIRGCSWTYGHMTSKPTGWHELAVGIQAYFCDSFLCNNGIYEQPDASRIRKEIIKNELNRPFKQTLTPQQLFILAGNTPLVMNTGEFYTLFRIDFRMIRALLSIVNNGLVNVDCSYCSIFNYLLQMNLGQPLISINTEPRQLRQCYSCTARSTGCGEFLDPRYVAKYIRPCISSCVIFRNPNDHNLITRDCSTTWPQIHAKSGLHKLLGSDAFFCQESLCNGISFDFIIGIFHNQLPAVITFPPIHMIENPPTTTISTIITATTTTVSLSISTTVDIDDNNAIWEDTDTDFYIFETTTTTIPITSTSSSFLTEFSEITDVPYDSSSIQVSSIEHFDFEGFGGGSSSTIVGGLAVAQQDSQLNWWDLNDASFPPLIESNNSPLPTTRTSTLIPSTNILTHVDQDEWSIFDTSTIASSTHFGYLSESNSELDFDMNDYFHNPILTTTPPMNYINNNNNTSSSFLPYYFTDYKTKEQLIDLLKPIPTLAMPPFSWMLHLANQNKGHLQNRKKLNSKILSTISSTIATTKNNKNKRIESKTLINNNNNDYLHKYCNKKQCQNGGHLNSNCLCICLPAFSGNNCEIVRCDKQPAHICDYVLEHECKNDYVRYLCPKFCQMNICSSDKSS
ncbi:unnamed protein product [Rotaria sordida]|uniref:EGF-like domain-containing protein n=1 Tax=Rotaria sordida TaxID=392033 RepID=A0A813QTD9_9BILA|nr:unnamed protein product [Rotaria sordida]